MLKFPSGPQRSSYAAFTLIELLVVIAIIAILASILFPVFGRARENARRSSCQSNMKQVGLGLTQYNQDYDEKMPYFFYDKGGAQPYFTWIAAINPYTKSNQIARCPSENRPFGGGGSYTQSVIPAYGFNYIYLNPNGCQSNAADDDYEFTPINLARIAQASATVAFVEVKPIGTDSTSYTVNPTAEAPGVLSETEPDECGYTNGGWGLGAWMDTGSVANGPITYTGDFAARHFSGGNVAFVDGHVKWFTPGRLASGTNWAAGKANVAVDITDSSQYMWDYR